MMTADAARPQPTSVAAEQEDGTFLRAKAPPYRILGYVAGVLVEASLE